MKWRVMEKRYKRKKYLYHAFIARYFTLELAKTYFQSLVDENIVIDEWRVSRRYPHTMVRSYLIGLLEERYGLVCDENNYAHTDPRYYEINYLWRFPGASEKARKKREYIEAEIDKWFYSAFIWMPSVSWIDDDKFGPTIRKKVFLVEDNAKNRRLIGVMDKLEKETGSVCDLLKEIRSRVRHSAKGRKKLIEICPPELLVDFDKHGNFIVDNSIKDKK